MKIKVLPLVLVVLYAVSPVWSADINFEDTTFESLIRLISITTGKNFLYDAGDSALKQQFKFVTPKGVGIKEDSLFAFFESIMEMKGYTLVEFPEYYKIIKVGASVPSNTAIITQQQISQLKDEEKLVSLFYPLNYISSQELIKVLNQIKTRVGRIISIQDTAILLYDYSSNIDTMLQIINSLDVKPEGTITKVLRLEYSQAQEIQQLLSKIFAPGRGAKSREKKGAQAEAVKIYSDKRLNALIVSGLKKDIEELEALIAKLDIKPEEEQTEIHMIAVRNGDAEDIAKKLQDVYADKQKRAKSTKGASADIMSRIPSIVPHASTNSIIVISPPDVFKELQTIVNMLDKKKDKVLIEALIVETTYDKMHDFGMELAAIKANASADYNVFGGALFGMSAITPTVDESGAPSFGRTPIPSNIPGLMAGITYKNSFSKLPLLIIAAREDRNVNIRSQPQIVANDNEEASFESAVEIPTLTQSFGSSGDFVTTTSQYYKASMLLKIVPHITEEDYLRLEIEQSTERFDLAVALSANLPPPKTSRSTKTTVTVPDGATVLLGGFSSESGSWSIKKVPLLGDIPLLRHFFRRKTWTENDSTVFVFVTAYIIRTNEDYVRISETKQRQLAAMKRLHTEYQKRKKSSRGRQE